MTSQAPDGDRRLSPIGPDAISRLTARLAEEATPQVKAGAEVAAAARRLIQELMSTVASEDQLLAAAGLVRDAAGLVAGKPHGRPYEGFAESSMAGDDRTFIEFSPFVGQANPLAPPLVLGVQGERVVGEGVFGDAYEGPPGCVHGGFIAGAFDEVLGFTMSFTGLIGMTGRLVVHYRQPTPLHRPLRFEARVDRVEGRKIFTRASLHADGVLRAEAEGLFIAVDPAVFEKLMEARDT